MSISIKFLGAAGTVTGSKYLVTGRNTKLLIDAGLFQGSREWRERNWNDPEFDLSKVNAVLLTHAHIDHTGILPRYAALGLKCPVYCSEATKSLCEILLPDAGALNEQETFWRQKEGKSRHKPPLPLFTEKDARLSLRLFRPVKMQTRKEVLPGVFATWNRMGHILGAASITLEIDGSKVTFSGDIGRYDVPILVNPQPVDFGDALLIESTYGDRLHDDKNPKEILAEVISRTAKRKGVVVIPSFAVGRAQLLLYYLRELKEENLIPRHLPIIIDSPMATEATDIYSKHPGDYDETALKILKSGKKPFSMQNLALVQTTEASKSLNRIDDSMVIISASGMLTGGRILHRLKNRISDERNSILFVGYQPPGGRGSWIQSGADRVKLLGEEVTIRAEISSISGLSAHGDRDEMLRWCRESSGTPKNVYVVHGEPDSAESFSKTLKEKLNWNASVAKYLDKIDV